MKTYPISEIFGPTIQGEGPLAGHRTFFVRFAGCDYDCSWCDTKYAVNPKYPDWKKEMMTTTQIVQSLRSLGAAFNDWVTLSGGNPVLFIDTSLLDSLSGYRIAVETQGSVGIPSNMFRYLDQLVVSPKPPSSRMLPRFDPKLLHQLIFDARKASVNVALKFVAFDDADLEFAADVRVSTASIPAFLSVGTPLSTPERPIPDDETRSAICERLKYLFEKVATDPTFRDFVVLPQLHVLAWGRKKGV